MLTQEQIEAIDNGVVVPILEYFESGDFPSDYQNTIFEGAWVEDPTNPYWMEEENQDEWMERFENWRKEKINQLKNQLC